jgi:hypothetical protein
MKLFPSSHYTFRLYGNENEAIERLNRRTEPSESFASKRTDKSFLGKIDGSTFKVISSEIGRGAFCVMSGKVEAKEGFVEIQINKPFQILLGIIIFFPIVAVGLSVISENIENTFILLLIAILQVLLIRFVFIELAFKFLSNNSLNRLKDVLDIDWIKKT